MFTVEERDRVRNRLVEMSRKDPRLVAGALIGSTAAGGGDRWSDSSCERVRGRSPVRSSVSVNSVQGLPLAGQYAGGFVVHSGEQVSRSGSQVRLALRERS